MTPSKVTSVKGTVFTSKRMVSQDEDGDGRDGGSTDDPVDDQFWRADLDELHRSSSNLRKMNRSQMPMPNMKISNVEDKDCDYVEISMADPSMQLSHAHGARR